MIKINESPLDHFEELVKCKEDCMYFIEKYVQIFSGRGLTPFQLRDYQKAHITNMLEIPRTLTLFSRQSGASMTVVAFILWKIIFSDNIKIFFTAPHDYAAIEQLKRVKTIFDNLPPWMQHDIQLSTNRRFILSNLSEVRVSSTNSKNIRGYDFDFLFVDNLSLVEDDIAREFMSNVLRIVKNKPDTKVAIFGTPRGKGNPFHELYESSGENLYTVQTIDWTKVPGRDEEWKNKQIELIGEINFRREYGCEFV